MQTPESQVRLRPHPNPTLRIVHDRFQLERLPGLRLPDSCVNEFEVVQTVEVEESCGRGYDGFTCQEVRSLELLKDRYGEMKNVLEGYFEGAVKIQICLQALMSYDTFLIEKVYEQLDDRAYKDLLYLEELAVDAYLDQVGWKLPTDNEDCEYPIEHSWLRVVTNPSKVKDEPQNP
ncbi:hypothetical protein K469DRAFT_697426 [Zopfia rhizophila CBS 207.26]|uniref:Uncharacterized protein n=1 Tax=Zopfia rhizophila CBS 207.26 TaxID=1314779 RepID=A0A6A6DI13_9PEZI|nr:hypothetical protein K469DRAFT_697426 [Zopfia rhizophila CBS 207.26]